MKFSTVVLIMACLLLSLVFKSSGIRYRERKIGRMKNSSGDKSSSGGKSDSGGKGSSGGKSNSGGKSGSGGKSSGKNKGAVIWSYGCSRLCPCRRDIDNITQRLDSLGKIQESFLSHLMGTLKKINNNVYQLMQVAASNKNTSNVLAHLFERLQGMIVEIQDIKADSGSTDDNKTEDKIQDIKADSGSTDDNKTEDKIQDIKADSGSTDDNKTEDSPKECPPSWVSFGGSCYYFQLRKVYLTQDQAKSQCESRYNGSSLVAIETLEEFNFLKEYLSNQYSSIRNITKHGWFIGGKKVEGQWKWESTGAPINFTVLTWDTWEPNGGMNSQFCLALYPNQFNLCDVFCRSFERQFICEIKTESTSEEKQVKNV